MIKLVGTFLNSQGKKHVLNMKEPTTNRRPEDIREAMELLTTLDIFEKDGVGLFQEVVSAKYVETVETPIFNAEELFGDPDQPLTLNQPQLSICRPMPKLSEPVVEIDLQSGQKALPVSVPKEIPSVPQISLSVKEAVKAPLETSPPIETRVSETKKHTAIKRASHIKELLKRKRRRKAKKTRQHHSADPPIL